MEQNGITIRAQLLAKKDGNYVVYVFKNLDTETYITVTKCPNWQDPEVEIGQEGFLTYKYVEAGKDTWFDGENFQAYQYSCNYYLLFIPTLYNIQDNLVLPNTVIVG